MNAALRLGFAAALGCYLIWGSLPLYIRAMNHIGAFELLAHRIIWSVPTAVILIALAANWRDVKAAFTGSNLKWLALSSILIAANWAIYIWSVNAGRAMEASLGYYINPLMSVALGAIFLGERLKPVQLVAVALAVVAVLVLTVEAGGMPWISLALASSFAVYGFLRKTLPIGPSQGFFLEVSILGIPSLAYVFWLQMHGTSHFVWAQPENMLLLVLCGPATAVPLMLYGFGARLLKFSTIGIMQYMAPTMVFLIAVFIFHEPFSVWKMVAFLLIWVGLALYSWSMFRPARRESAGSGIAG